MITSPVNVLLNRIDELAYDLDDYAETLVTKEKEEELEYWQDETAYANQFGYFEERDDPEAAKASIAHCEAKLKEVEEYVKSRKEFKDILEDAADSIRHAADTVRQHKQS